MKLLVTLKDLVETALIVITFVFLIPGAILAGTVAQFMPMPAKFVLPVVIGIIVLFEIIGWGGITIIILNLIF